MAEPTSQGPDAKAAGALSLGGELPVARMGFGAMRITGEGIWGDPPDVPGARALLRRVVELGVTFIDTADAYGPEVSERLLGETLHPYGPVVIATKGGLKRTGPGGWHTDGRPEHLLAACDASLRRLKVECITLYQLHAVDDRVPLEESVGALARLREAGKVRFVGLSNVRVPQLRRAQGIVPIASVQNRYNIADRTHEEVLVACEREHIAFIPWYPIGSGALGRSGGGLAAEARARGLTPSQLAIAWLLARSPVMLPIPGTASLAHLEENVAAARVKLTPVEVDQLAAKIAGSPP